MKKIIALLVLVLVSGFGIGCTRAYKTISDARVVPIKSQDKIYDTVTAILIDRGFDIKFANKDVGAISTEYKKYGAFGNNPPFDLFLQVKIKVSQVPNKFEITLTPVDKVVNRLNAGAFTEGAMAFYEGNKATGLNILDVHLPGFFMFMNIVQDVATAFGVPIENVTFNTTDAVMRIL